jgi:UDP-glucose 4-epimerase
MTVEKTPQAVVLGAGGFVGRHAARALARRGFRVIGLGHGDWTSAQWSDWGIARFVRADISLEALEALPLDEAPACVIHCGGSGAVSFSYAQPLEDFRRTAESTVEMLEWVRRHGAGQCRAVLVSSAAVYGDQGDTDATENVVRAPISPYGVHKLSAEAMCESYSRFFSLPVSVVRLFSVYGEGLRKQLLWDALNKFAAGEHQFFGTGHELRDWIHVDDAAELLCAAAQAPQARFEVYNGGHQQATTSHVLGLLAEAAGTSLRPRFNGETHTGNPRRLTADCGHARRQLSWSPQVTLEDGLARYAAWFGTAAPRG